MNKTLNPAILAGVAVVAIVVLLAVGWHMLQPAPYTPSPGVVNGATPGVPSTAKPIMDGGAGQSGGSPGQGSR